MKHKNGMEVLIQQNDGKIGHKTFSGTRNDDGKPTVYLIYDLPDQLPVQDLKNYLIKGGYFVLEPPFEGTLIDRRNKHENNLVTTDIILIYYGRENMQWLETKLLDVLKSPGLGRDKHLMESAIYVPQQVKIADKAILNHRVEKIYHDDIFPPQSLKEFFNKAGKIYAAVSE